MYAMHAVAHGIGCGGHAVPCLLPATLRTGRRATGYGLCGSSVGLRLPPRHRGLRWIVRTMRLARWRRHDTRAAEAWRTCGPLTGRPARRDSRCCRPVRRTRRGPAVQLVWYLASKWHPPREPAACGRVCGGVLAGDAGWCMAGGSLRRAGCACGIRLQSLLQRQECGIRLQP
jgi:hypothetical protein